MRHSPTPFCSFYVGMLLPSEQPENKITANLHQAAVDVHREDFFVISALAEITSSW